MSYVSVCGGTVLGECVSMRVDSAYRQHDGQTSTKKPVISSAIDELLCFYRELFEISGRNSRLQRRCRTIHLLIHPLLIHPLFAMRYMYRYEPPALLQTSIAGPTHLSGSAAVRRDAKVLPFRPASAELSLKPPLYGVSTRPQIPHVHPNLRPHRPCSPHDSSCAGGK